MDLPDPLPLSADEITAIAYVARLTDACEPILIADSDSIRPGIPTRSRPGIPI
jgi:hypothetical protein